MKNITEIARIIIARTIEKDYSGLKEETKAKGHRIAKKLFYATAIIFSVAFIAEDIYLGSATLPRAVVECSISIVLAAVFSFAMLDIYYFVTEYLIKDLGGIKRWIQAYVAKRRKKENSQEIRA